MEMHKIVAVYKSWDKPLWKTIIQSYFSVSWKSNLLNSVSNGITQYQFGFQRNAATKQLQLHISLLHQTMRLTQFTMTFRRHLTTDLYLLHVFWVAGKPTCILLKRTDILSQKNLCCKKGQAQLLNDLKMWLSLWGQEEKAIPAWLRM